MDAGNDIRTLPKTKETSGIEVFITGQTLESVTVI